MHLHDSFFCIHNYCYRILSVQSEINECLSEYGFVDIKCKTCSLKDKAKSLSVFMRCERLKAKSFVVLHNVSYLRLFENYDKA